MVLLIYLLTTFQPRNIGVLHIPIDNNNKNKSNVLKRLKKNKKSNNTFKY